MFAAGDVPTDDLGAEVVLASANLANRELLRLDLERAADADVFVVEVKAAAIDVVAEEAERRGVEVVLAANDVVPSGDVDLDAAIEGLVRVPA